MSDPQKETNGWKTHELHVMSSLERLETQQNIQTTQIAEIHKEIVGFKTNQKWAVRFGMAVWGIVVTGINYLLGKH